MTLAIVSAITAALFFSAASVYQHTALRAIEPSKKATRAPEILRAALSRRWLIGAGCTVGGVSLHALALSRAPLSLIQPIGVVAVPVTVIVTFWVRRKKLPWMVLLGLMLTTVGMLGFIGVVHITPPSTDVAAPSAMMLGGALIVGAAVGELSRQLKSKAQSVGYALAGAVSFGVVSATLRTLIRYTQDQGLLPDMTALSLIIMMIAASMLGAWYVQLSLASGPPGVTLAVLTIVDPVVAVGLGVLSGDGQINNGPTVAGFLVLTGIGVLLLTKHHPQRMLDRPQEILDRTEN